MGVGEDGITGEVIGAAIAVHRELGPGLLESAYEACLAYELSDRGMSVECQKSLPVVYRSVNVECGYRMDMVVEGALVVELKTVERIMPIHEAQLLSYLRLSGHRFGLLLNFNVNVLKDGIRRLVNGYSNQ